MSKIQLHAAALSVLMLVAIAANKQLAPSVHVESYKTDFVAIPLQLRSWTGTNLPVDKVTAEGLPYASVLERNYDSQGLYPVNLTIVYGNDLGSFHQPEVCLEGQGLHSESKRIIQITEPGGRSFPAIALITQSGYMRNAFVYWFQTGSMTSVYLGNYKLKIFFDRLSRKTVRPSAMVRLSTFVSGSDDDAIQELVNFSKELHPYVHTMTAGRPSGGH